MVQFVLKKFFNLDLKINYLQTGFYKLVSTNWFHTTGGRDYYHQVDELVATSAEDIKLLTGKKDEGLVALFSERYRQSS